MKGRVFTALVLCAGLTAGASRARGQVNTEKLRAWSKPGYSGHLDGRLSWQAGNVEQLEVGAGLRAQYARFGATTSTTGPVLPPIDHVYLVGDLVVGVQGDERFKNAGFLHVRYTRHVRPWFAGEGFYQAQYNEFVRLEQRQLVGLGARFEVVRRQAMELAMGTGFMLEYERQNVPEGGSDLPDMLSFRSTTYLSLKLYSAAPKVSAINTVYAQPRVDAPSDFRILNEGELSVHVTAGLHLAVAFSLRFDSRPVSGVKELDTRLVNRLRYAF